MRDMLPVDHGMAIRTYDNKIREIVVMPVMVNMVHTQNFLALIESTFLTFLKHSPSDHVFSDRAENCFPRYLGLFSNTFFRAKNSLLTGRIKEFFTTMFTLKFHLLIIFCFGALQFGKPDRFTFFLGQMPKTFTRTGNGFLHSVRFYLKRIITVSAKESYHAA